MNFFPQLLGSSLFNFLFFAYWKILILSIFLSSIWSLFRITVYFRGFKTKPKDLSFRYLVSLIYLFIIIPTLWIIGFSLWYISLRSLLVSVKFSLLFFHIVTLCISVILIIWTIKQGIKFPPEVAFRFLRNMFKLSETRYKIPFLSYWMHLIRFTDVIVHPSTQVEKKALKIEASITKLFRFSLSLLIAWVIIFLIIVFYQSGLKIFQIGPFGGLTVGIAVLVYLYLRFLKFPVSKKRI